jgi:CRP/FNR family nitrogen fixation transcriptional regulator
MLNQTHLTRTIDAKRPIALPQQPTAVARKASRLDDAFRLIGAPMRFDRDSEIYGEDEPVEYFYQVISGAARTYKVLSDGRRQIGAFYLPGDVFGLEAGTMHRFSAEAIGAATIRVAGRAAITGMASRDVELAAELWTLTAERLEHAEEHMLLLGRKTAEERVASFLLEMAGRVDGGSVIQLPMSRQDIADYLGLTIETVSRTFTQLESKAAIELPSSRRVTLRNRGALQRMNA